MQATNSKFVHSKFVQTYLSFLLGYQHFLLSPLCFQKLCPLMSRLVKGLLFTTQSQP